MTGMVEVWARPAPPRAGAARVLADPVTKLPLFSCSLSEAEVLAGGGFRNRMGASPGPAVSVLLCEGGACLYPVENGIPVLLAPEAYLREAEPQVWPDLRLPQYAEAYAGMAEYNRVAARRAIERRRAEYGEQLAAARSLVSREQARFPEPDSIWCDQLYECTAQREAYARLAPLAGKRVLQMGGTGNHALKFLLAGAAEAWLVTPMLAEAEFTRALAEELGLGDRLHAVAGIGEELPLAGASFDGIYAGSCLHHMVTGLAGAEARRVLAPGGVFVAIDPWLAPLHRVGTKLMGKRERGVHCHPLDRRRMRAFAQGFPEARCVRYGALARYPMLGMQKFGAGMRDAQVRRWMEWDERACLRAPLLRRWGSVSLIAATRPPETASISVEDCRA